jgi:taurine dioxygenase
MTATQGLRPIDDVLAAARARLRRLDPGSAAAARDAGALLIDIRPDEARVRDGEIPGALAVDRNVLEWRLDPASPDRLPQVSGYEQPIVLFCREGYASSLAAAALHEIGLVNATDLAGGFAAWAMAGFPVRRREPQGGGPIEIDPLTGTLGAVVAGLDLRRLGAPEVAVVRAAVLRHRVLFFRDQHLGPDEQVALGRQFGELTPAHPLVGGLDAAHPEVLVLDSADYPLGVGDRGRGTSYNNRWHTDVTFSERPPLGAILVAREVPACGGDTLWADLVGAYASLSPQMQRLLDDLHAVHDTGGTFDRFRGDDATGTHREALAALAPVRHPVVRVHPETRERVLFVNPTFTRRVLGLPASESRALLAFLYDHQTRPERTVRWRWRVGDVAFWDNRSTAHYVAADHGDARRVMHRITIAGDRPVGVDETHPPHRRST